jgi:hypothetical protein
MSAFTQAKTTRNSLKVNPMKFFSNFNQPSIVISRSLARSVFGLLATGLLSAPVQAQMPSFANNLLTLPQVTVGAKSYSAQLQVTNQSPLEFRLASAVELSAAETSTVLEGVWKTKVTIVQCQTRATLAGPFAGLITFAAGGTVTESGPATPGIVRGPAHGAWSRTGRNTFAETLIFQRANTTGDYLGTQEIQATVTVADDSRSYQAEGNFYSKDPAGSTAAVGCSTITATRFG